ncbi:MAG: hypothetical protein CL829_03370 [Crocinitomicaceae bacterium]|nr:hypothetical protein [Crocinitomicaceae bacterium]
MSGTLRWACTVLGIISWSLACSQSSPSVLDEWRALYRQAALSETAGPMAQSMAAICEQSPSNAQARGFHAVAELMLAEETWNPMDKLQRFNEWKPVLEGVLSELPHDPDMALLRLGVQEHVPLFLDYHDDMTRDQAIVQQGLDSKHWAEDPEHQLFVQEFLLSLKATHNHTNPQR